MSDCHRETLHSCVTLIWQHVMRTIPLCEVQAKDLQDMGETCGEISQTFLQVFILQCRGKMAARNNTKESSMHISTAHETKVLSFFAATLGVARPNSTLPVRRAPPFWAESAREGALCHPCAQQGTQHNAAYIVKEILRWLEEVFKRYPKNGDHPQKALSNPPKVLSNH